MYKILSAFLLWSVLTVSYADTTPLKYVPIKISLPCGPTKLVFEKLKDEMQLTPLLTGTEVVGDMGVITTVWISQWEQDQEHAMMAVTETTTKGTSCIISSSPNAKFITPGKEM